MKVPVIDVSELVSRGTGARAVAQKISSACREFFAETMVPVQRNPAAVSILTVALRAFCAAAR